MPRVSVLVPAYNAERYVDDAMRSIAAQTFGDWEVVAVDDHSSDRTFEILSGWEAREPRVRVFRNDNNAGMTANWNLALAKATGELVVKLDADDAFRPRTLEVLVGAMGESGVVGAAVRTLCCDENLEPFDGMPGDDAMRRGGIDPYVDATRDCADFYRIAGYGEQLWHSCALILPREFLVDSGGYDEHFGCASDTELGWRALEQPGRFAHRAYVGVLYRIVSSSVSAVFRSNGWLTWEAVAANLLSLHRLGARRVLPRRLRYRYAAQWELWQSAVDRNKKSLPIYPKLADVVGHLRKPPLGDRLLVRTRSAISSFAARH
jgi:glycosyltransferase involved in cell wall biosynthesis